MKYIVIGAGMSGLAIANMLQDDGHEVKVLERDDRVGGMIKCDRVEGCLFHRTGGHVFNTKRQDVMDWFWQHFDRECEFSKAVRNSAVVMGDGLRIPYPIENHAYMLPAETQRQFIADLLQMGREGSDAPANFEQFLQARFGKTLYDLYFGPYNRKVWRRPLSDVPLDWLEGKLPMPTAEEMIFNNMNHVEERQFVHSTFYYPRQGGSQFLANRLAEGLCVETNHPVKRLERTKAGWLVDGEACDAVVYCANLKLLPQMLAGAFAPIEGFAQSIEQLAWHGTTSVFCQIDPNDYSWLYMPSAAHEAHRIICTGNFAPSNNASGMMTATVEFTDEMGRDAILDNLARIPYHPRYLTHHYEPYTYPIQTPSTRPMIAALKQALRPHRLHLLGRFAEWEYCNMDVAIGSALDGREEME